MLFYRMTHEIYFCTSYNLEYLLCSYMYVSIYVCRYIHLYRHMLQFYVFTNLTFSVSKIIINNLVKYKNFTQFMHLHTLIYMVSSTTVFPNSTFLKPH